MGRKPEHAPPVPTTALPPCPGFYSFMWAWDNGRQAVSLRGSCVGEPQPSLERGSLVLTWSFGWDSEAIGRLLLSLRLGMGPIFRWPDKVLVLLLVLREPLAL